MLRRILNFFSCHAMTSIVDGYWKTSASLDIKNEFMDEKVQWNWYYYMIVLYFDSVWWRDSWKKSLCTYCYFCGPSWRWFNLARFYFCFFSNAQTSAQRNLSFVHRRRYAYDECPIRSLLLYSVNIIYLWNMRFFLSDQLATNIYSITFDEEDGDVKLVGEFSNN